MYVRRVRLEKFRSFRFRSKYSWFIPLKTRSEICAVFHAFRLRVENMFGHKINFNACNWSSIHSSCPLRHKKPKRGYLLLQSLQQRFLPTNLQDLNPE